MRGRGVSKLCAVIQSRYDSCSNRVDVQFVKNYLYRKSQRIQCQLHITVNGTKKDRIKNNSSGGRRLNWRLTNNLVTCLNFNLSGGHHSISYGHIIHMAASILIIIHTYHQKLYGGRQITKL